MKEALVYTNDNMVVLFKHGLKNRTVDRHYLMDPQTLLSKQGSEFEVYELDMDAADVPRDQAEMVALTGKE